MTPRRASARNPQVGNLFAVVPVFNEVTTVGPVVHALRARCPVIVVDDASTDGSDRRAARAGALCVIRHACRRGKGAALRAGFAEALRRSASLVATLDGDGQHDPVDLPRLLDAARATPDAVVVGNRFGPLGGDRVPLIRFGAIRCADWFLGRLTGTTIDDTQCGFRIYPAELLRRVALREEGFVLETEVLVRAVREGYRLVSVPIRRLYPAGRRSRFRTLGDGAQIGWYIVRQMTRRPEIHARGARPPYPVVAPERLPAVSDL